MYSLLKIGQKDKEIKTPPTTDSLQQHTTKRGNNQACVLKKAQEPTHNLPPAAGHGWNVQGGALQPVLMTKDPAPRGLPELAVWETARSQHVAEPTAHVEPTTETCVCMAKETCENPRTACESTDK